MRGELQVYVTLKKATILFSLIFLITISFVPMAHAEAGDFYEKYEEEFDNPIYSDTDREFVEAYDLESNSFDCGITQIYCHANSIIYSSIIGILNFSIDGLGLVVGIKDWFIDEPKFNVYKKYLSQYSTTLFAAFIIYQIMVAYAKNFSNMEDMGNIFSNKFLVIFVGAAFLGLYNDIMKLIISIQNSASTAILKVAVDKEAFALITFKYSTKYSILIMAVVGIIMVIFLILIGYRFVAFSVMYVLGPVAITTIANDEFNYFNIWFKYIINNAVTLIVQSLCLSFAIGSLTLQFKFLKDLPFLIDMVAGIILAASFCLFALAIPMILGQLGASSGTGRAIGKMIRFASQRR